METKIYANKDVEELDGFIQEFLDTIYHTLNKYEPKTDWAEEEWEIWDDFLKMLERVENSTADLVDAFDEYIRTYR